jgi:hypothetical protein
VTGNRPMTKRLALLLLPLCLAASLAAASATARASSVKFLFVPARALQGSEVAVRISVRPLSARCSLSVRYNGGGTQSGLAPARARNGLVEWRWVVPKDTQAGVARLTASCKGAGRVTVKLLVVGQLIPIKVDVVKRGYSIRPLPYGGTSVSYGVILHNESQTQDALNVNVLVNFVMADNKLLGSESTNVAQISAGSDYAVGSDLTFPGAAPIERLEVVVQVGSHGVHGALPPATANIHVLPDPYDPGWVGSVEGELINDHPDLLLSNASLSAVVFDAAGNVLGGGSGYAFQTLPPGTREFIKITNGLKAVPITQAASAVVSIDASWRQPGS